MTKLLETIDSPAKLRKLSLAQCKQLAHEIRTEILKTVSRTGGHLAPNLGVVELTLALHRAFDTPRDKIVWDVGHQSYVHKLMTGRGSQFCTLRQHKGMSGFPKRQESEYDCFDTGHSSTSISAAMGLALARDLRKENYQVLAVIGDGALTGGMAFEAMNMVGHRKTNLTVILNDNEMSIGENVGALATYLSKIRSDPKYFKGKEDLEQILHKIPRIGKAVLRAMERVKDSFKYLVVPGMLFEELGFTYLGPIDGHDMEALNKVLADAKKLQEPVLVHILTKKGKGYGPAEENPDKFHGTGPFDLATGQVIKHPGPPSYTSVFGKCLAKLAEQDQRILAITAAMPEGTGLNFFANQFPERYFDVGIAEQHAVTMAAALAADGFKPVVAIYSTFLQRAYDQVLHDVCLQNLPVILALDRAGLVGEDGPTHHGLFDLAYLRHIPNMLVMSPKDENELQQMLVTAIAHDGPCAIRYPRGGGRGVTLEETPVALPVGQGEVLKEGESCTIMAIGSMVHPALEAAEMLAERGIKATVLNCRFVKPLDADMILKYARPGSLVVTVEEHGLQGGFGSAVLELLEQNRVNGVNIHCMGVPDEFVEHGKPEILKEKYMLNARGICVRVQAELARRPVAGSPKGGM